MTTIEAAKYHDSDYQEVLGIIIEFQKYITALDTNGLCREFDSTEEAGQYFDQLQKDVREREGTILLAKDGNKIVGFIQGIIDRHKDDVLYATSHKPGDYGWVGELYVDPKYRRQGIATQLMDAMIDYFKKNGCVNVRLMVMADNKLALEAYEKMGFYKRDYEMAKEI